MTPDTLTFVPPAPGATPATQEVEVAAEAPFYLLKSEISNFIVQSTEIVRTGDRTARVIFHPVDTALAPLGTSTATVRLLGCEDIRCTSQVDGSPKTVNVAYIKTAGGLTGSPSTLSFSQALGGAPPAASSVTIQDRGDASYAWVALPRYQSGTGWLTVTPSSGNALPTTVSIGVTPPATAGVYVATVAFADTTGTTLFNLNVTYNVTP